MDDKNTIPKDISRTRVPHVTYLLQRETARSQLRELGRRVRRRVGARIRTFKRNLGKN